LRGAYVADRDQRGQLPLHVVHRRVQPVGQLHGAALRVLRDAFEDGLVVHADLRTRALCFATLRTLRAVRFCWAMVMPAPR
jgi:hypothetical protein